MKNKSIILSLAAFSLMVLGTGCNKQETTAPSPVSEAPKTPDRPAADAPSAAQAQAAADAQKVAADAAAQKQADADKAAQAEKQAQADKLAQAEKQAQADKLAADQAAAQKPAQVVPAASKVQGLIDTAKKLSSEKKWADVLKVLAQLTGQQLTPAQQGVVDGLKSDAQKQAQAAVTDKATQDAGNAIGGLLGPK